MAEEAGLVVGNDDDDDMNGVEEEEEEEEEQLDAVDEEGVANADAMTSDGSAKKSKKKKKKKTKKGKTNVNSRLDDSPDATPTRTKKNGSKGKSGNGGGVTRPNEEEDLDALLNSMGITLNAPSTASTTDGNDDNSTSNSMSSSSSCEDLLRVDPRFTKAESELRRIFGARALANESERPTRGGSRRMVPGAGGGGGMRMRMRRGGPLLVTPKDFWPPSDGDGLGMQADGAGFRFSWSPNYASIQRTYLACVATHDPNMIVHEVLQKHPFHIDSLMAMAELYRHTGETETSGDFIERALFAMEAAFHPSFSPQSACPIPGGTPLLDFMVEENKSFFTALSLHVASLSRRGCHRAAFELSKLLFKLDMRDPTGVLLRLDYAAIRAEKMQWLLSFLDTYAHSASGDSGRLSLGVMPNFSFGRALAKFLLCEEARNKAGSGSRQASSSSSAASKRAVDERAADDALAAALALHPGLFLRLVSKLPIASDKDWTFAMSHAFFVSSASDESSATLVHLFDIYVERSCVLWRGKPEQDFLKAAAVRVARAADRMMSNVASSSTDDADTSDSGVELISGMSLEAWTAASLTAFPPSAINDYAHLSVASYSDSIRSNQLNEAL